MNVAFLHHLFPYLPPSDWVSIVRTCKDTARNSNLIQQQVFSARFHLKVTLPEKTQPGAIYTFHKQFAQNPAARTWALKTGTSVRFPASRLDQCILLPGSLVAGLSGKVLEIRNGHTRINLISFKHKIALLAASPDGKTIAAGSFQHDIFVQSRSNPKMQTIASSNLHDLAAKYGKVSLESLSFLPDGRLFTAYHTQSTGLVIVWKLAPEKREQPILIERFRLEACNVSPSGRSFLAAGIEIVDESPRSFERDQPLSTPQANPLRMVFSHYDFARKKLTTVLPPGYPHASVKPKQFAVVSDDAFVAALDDPGSKPKLLWMKFTQKTGKKIEDLTDGYEITSLCLGTNGLLHAITQWSLNTPAITRNQLRTYDLSTYKRISCIQINPLAEEKARILFLSTIPGALAFATAQNGHANLITFRSAVPATAASSSTSSAAIETIDLIDNDSLDLHLSPSLQSPPSVPLASPKAFPPNSPPEPPQKSTAAERKRRYQLTLSTAAASSSSSSNSSAAPPAKYHRPTLDLIKK